MPMSFHSIEPPRECKVCKSNVRFVGTIDANKCCQDRMGKRTLPLSGNLIPYYSCNSCGLVFTNFMDEWSVEEFKNNIYNQEYDLINPAIPGQENVPFKESPSYQKGLLIASLFRASQNEIRILDFGAGGNPGPTGQALIDQGFSVDSYEPFRADCPEPQGKYDLIICVEVLEHCHDPANVAAHMKKLLSRDGLIWIQTLLHPTPTPLDILDSWYISPRDGHITIHTFFSLTILFNQLGLNFVQTAQGLFAFGKAPTFQNQVLLTG